MSHNYKFLTARHNDDITVIDLTEGAADFLKQDEFAPELLAFIDDTKPTNLLINLSAIRSCTSSFIGALIAARQRLKNLGSQMKLCNLSEHLRADLQSMNLAGKIFEIHETEDVAMTHF